MKRFLCLPAVAALALSGLAHAAEAPSAQGVVTLSASASVETPPDLLNVALSVSRDGADAVAVQSALKQALDAALTEAKKVVVPGQIEARTGNFTLFPRYSKQSVISGWQGNAELVLEGRNMPAIAALTGRITSMTVSRVSYSLSRQAREQLEGELAAQAIARFRERAADYAKQFGYSSFGIREVSVSAGFAGSPAPAPRMMQAYSATSESALPVEPGRSTVTVTVSGSVQMK